MKKDRNSIVIRGIAIIEILIGLTIASSFIIPSLFSAPGNPKALYVFVIATSLISIIIGIGLFKYKNWGRQFLIFFSGYVIFTKILIVSHLITFTGNTIDFMANETKDMMSLIYHVVILIVFNLKSIKSKLT